MFLILQKDLAAISHCRITPESNPKRVVTPTQHMTKGFLPAFLSNWAEKELSDARGIGAIAKQ